METWKVVVGFPDYAVSSTGQVKRIDTGRILKQKTRRYQQDNLYPRGGKSEDRKTVEIHRLVAKAFIKNPENKKCINHRNGIKSDNNVENLEWSTHSENLNHAYRTGLRKKHKGLPLLIYRHQTQI